jgi:hypothetical protein
MLSNAGCVAENEKGDLLADSFGLTLWIAFFQGTPETLLAHRKEAMIYLPH